VIWFQLAACILIILFFGRKVARYGDIIAVKTGVGGLWVGLVLISVTTSLPELFTGVSAILIIDVPDLTMGNLLGANTFNLLNLAFLDIFYRNQSILNTVSRGQRTTAWYSLILVGITAFSIFLQPIWSHSLGWVGWATPLIVILYLFFIRQIFLLEKKNPRPEIPEEIYGSTTLQRTLIYFTISALFIIGAGIWLALIGDQISQSTGLGDNFVGSLLIGLTTTLPEVTVSYSALRFGAFDLAVANMIGSNMFNMLLICLDDLILTKGSIYGAISRNNLVTAITVILMTFVILVGLYFKPRKLGRLSWFNLLTIIIFLIGTYINFILNR
jgi:cation:H+ antiporter